MDLKTSLLFLAVGCGPAVTVTNLKECQQISGWYSVEPTLTSQAGNCSQVLSMVGGNYFLHFTENGIEPPLGSASTCSTKQDDCHIEIACNVNGVNAHGQLIATLSGDGQELNGVLSISGNYQGCTQLVFDSHSRKTGP